MGKIDELVAQTIDYTDVCLHRLPFFHRYLDIDAALQPRRLYTCQLQQSHVKYSALLPLRFARATAFHSNHDEKQSYVKAYFRRQFVSPLVGLESAGGSIFPIAYEPCDLANVSVLLRQTHRSSHLNHAYA